MLEDDYKNYKNSPSWERFEREYFRGHAKKCCVCDSSEVELHHHTYARLGREAPSDVVPFCEEHHVAVHEFHRKRRARQSLTVSTQQFIWKTAPQSAVVLSANPSERGVSAVGKRSRDQVHRELVRRRAAEAKIARRQRQPRYGTVLAQSYGPASGRVLVSSGKR